MNTFDGGVTVRMPLEALAEFHADTHALRRLTPPPIIVQFHRVEPLAEGSTSDFTLWFGPLPIRWTAVHSQVDRLHGFTDTQARGPMKYWRHSHRFEAVDDKTAKVSDHVEYLHFTGPRGWLSRLLFSRPALGFVFAYRAWIMRRTLEPRTSVIRRWLLHGLGVLVILALLSAAVPSASAHRPVWGDGSGGVLTIDNLATSFAFYRNLKPAALADVYAFEAKAGDHLHAGISVPALPGLQDYEVSLAVMGPGLSTAPHHLLPENHPEGVGAVIVGSVRGEDFFESFTQTNYWGRQRVELDLPQTGTYYLLVWQPQGQPGKYVLDTGTAEVFGPADLLAFPIWWLKVHEFFGQTFPSLALMLVALPVLGLIAAAGWLALRKGKRKLVPQPVRVPVNETRRQRRRPG